MTNKPIELGDDPSDWWCVDCGQWQRDIDPDEHVCCAEPVTIEDVRQTLEELYPDDHR